MIREYAETCLTAKKSSNIEGIESNDPLLNALWLYDVPMLEYVIEHADLIDSKLPNCPAGYPLDQFIARVLIFRPRSDC